MNTDTIYLKRMEYKMAILPKFLIQKISVKGSLKKIDEKIKFKLKNVLGPGELSGLTSVTVNDEKYLADEVEFETQAMHYFAKDITAQNPVKFRLGQEGTLILNGKK